MGSRLWLLLHSLWWPLVVWLVLVLPQISWSASDLTEAEQEWAFKPLLWVCRHVWPYSRIARARQRWDAWDEWELPPPCRRCGQPLEAHTSLLTLVRRMPARLDLGLQPLSQPEADSWMAARRGPAALTLGLCPGASPEATPEP